MILTVNMPYLLNTDTHNTLKSHGKMFYVLKHAEAANIHILDNECLFEMKKAFDEAEVKY